MYGKHSTIGVVECCICHTACSNWFIVRVVGSKDFHHIQNFNSALWTCNIVYQCYMHIQHCLSVLYAHTALFNNAVCTYSTVCHATCFLYSIVKSFDPPTQRTIKYVILDLLYYLNHKYYIDSVKLLLLIFRDSAILNLSWSIQLYNCDVLYN